MERNSDNDSFFLEESRDEPISQMRLQSSNGAHVNSRFFRSMSNPKNVSEKKPMDVLMKDHSTRKMAFSH